MSKLIKNIAVSLLVFGTINAMARESLIDGSLSKENGWNFWLDKSVLDAGGSGVLQDGKAIVNSPAVEKQVFSNIQLYEAIELDAEKSYMLKFKANTDKAGRLTVTYGLNKAPYTNYASAVIVVEPGEKVYECTLAVKKSTDGNFNNPHALRLCFGNFKDTTVTVSEVLFKEIK